MASQTILALAALVCLAAFAIAQPLDDDVQVLLRARRAAARRGGMAFAGYAAHTRDSPAYASPEEDAEEEDEPVRADCRPQRPGRARPSRPSRPQPPQSEEDEEEDGPPSQGSQGGGKGGATAIANAYSRGNGASSNSHATAYGGRFSGGMFKHSYGGK